MARIVIKIPRRTKVFLLEDSEERITWFRERIPDITLAETASQAIEVLSTHEPYDFVFLDHDLGLLDYAGYNETGVGNGQEVAKHLAETGFLGSNVVIHSWNPTGAAKMAALLKNQATVIQFGQFEILRTET